MRRRYRIFGLGLALIGGALGAPQCQGQFGNGTNFPVLTYLGRYHGIGYSQGYHACNSGNCSPVSQLHPSPSAPISSTRPLALPTSRSPRDPWPDLGGNNWIQYQKMDHASSGGYSLYSTPDPGNPAEPIHLPSFLPLEPIGNHPEPSRPVAPTSPSDTNPRLRPPVSAEPLPAPRTPQPSVPTTSQRLNPLSTIFPFR